MKELPSNNNLLKSEPRSQIRSRSYSRRDQESQSSRPPQKLPSYRKEEPKTERDNGKDYVPNSFVRGQS